MSTETSAGPTPAEKQSLRDALRLVREALAGREHVYTSGPVGRSVVLLAIPMMLEMAMESVFILVDIYWVSRLGAEAVAAVGLTEAVLTLLYAVAIGLSMGVTAHVARRVGENDLPAARVVAAQTIWVALAAAVLIGVGGLAFAEEILRAMGATEAVVADGRLYTQIMLGGAVTILLIFLLNAIFRGAGNAVIAMRALWIANGVNLALDPLLIFGIGPFPELGVAGAAVATNIGRGVGVLYQVVCLTHGATRIRFGLSDMRIDTRVMFRLLRVSLGAVLQFLIATTSYLFLMRIVARYGSAAVAGFTIGIRLFAFTFLPAWGLGNAAATLMGQNLGAGQPERAAASAWRAAAYNAVFLTSVALVFIAFAETFAGLFTAEPAVLGYAADTLRYLSYGYGFYAIGMVLTQAFNGAGDTDTPTLINFACLWVLQLPLAYVLAETLALGTTGVLIAIAVSDSTLALVAIWIFRRGRWKNAVV